MFRTALGVGRLRCSLAILTASICAGWHGHANAQPLVVTIAGSGKAPFEGDGGAHYTNMRPLALAVGHDGTIYFTDMEGLIRKVTPDFTGVETLAGVTDPPLVSPSGQRTTRLRPGAITLHPINQEVWLVDDDHRILVLDFSNKLQEIPSAKVQFRRKTDGSVQTLDPSDVALTIHSLAIDPRVGELYFTGALSLGGIRANKQWRGGMFKVGYGGGLPAQLSETSHSDLSRGHPALTFSALDGTYYLIRGNGTKIYRGSVDKRLHGGQPAPAERIAGTGQPTFEGDGPALTTNIAPTALAIHPHTGELFFSDRNNYIRKITSRGRIETVAGTGSSAFNGDGPADEASLSATSLAFDAHGILFFCGELRIRALVPDDASDEVIASLTGQGVSALRRGETERFEGALNDLLLLAAHPALHNALRIKWMGRYRIPEYATQPASLQLYRRSRARQALLELKGKQAHPEEMDEPCCTIL